MERQNAVDQENLVVGTCQSPLHESTQLYWHGGVNLETDDRSAPSALEHRLEFTHQVFGRLLDRDLGLANDTESTQPSYRVARRLAAHEHTDNLRKRPPG